MDRGNSARDGLRFSWTSEPPRLAPGLPVNKCSLRGRAMRNGTAVMAGLVLGLGVMYLIDPDRGRQRRDRIRDRAARAARVGGHAAALAGRNLLDRTAGAAAHLQSLRCRTVDDDVLIERIRAQMDTVVSFPHAV